MRPTTLIFPGQGSQRVGMLESVPETEDLERLLDAAEALADIDLRRRAAHGPEAELADTRVAQPLLYLADWAWGRALIDAGVEPAGLAGHSLGEFAALAVARVFSVEAGLALIVERSRLMAACAASTPGTMAACLGLDRSVVDGIVAGIEDVWVANDNCSGQVVVSGTLSGVATAQQALTAAGARRVLPLKVAGAFHSPLMSAAAGAFADILRETEFGDAAYPVYQNTDPVAASDAEAIKMRLIQQMVSPVRWTETVSAMTRDGIALAIETGPGSVLTGLARRGDGPPTLAVEDVGIGAVLEEVAL